MTARNTTYSLANAVAAATAGNLVGPYVGIYAIRLGADDLQLGYLSSWPNILSVVAVLGVAAAVAGSRAKQRLIAGIILAGRAAILGASALPWLPESSRIWALILFWVLSVFPNSAAGTAMQSFLADVFPGPERGRAFAARNSWSTGAGMVVVLASGWALDNIFTYPTGYQVMFALSFLFGLAEIAFFLRLRPAEEVEAAQPHAAEGRPPRLGVAAYLEVFRHRPYLQFLAVSLPFHFTWQMVWPVFTRFQVSVMHADNTWLSIFSLANSIVAMISYPLWAKAAERWGNLRVMGFAAFWICLAPLLTSLAPSLAWLVPINFITGVGPAGVVVLVLQNLLEVSPAEGRPVYLAVHAALVAVGASVAPMVGAYLMALAEPREVLFYSTFPRMVTAASFFLLFYVLGRRKGIVGAVEKAS